MTTRLKNKKSSFTMALAVVFRKGQSFRVPCIIHYDQDVLVADFGSVPIRSIPIHSKGTSMMGNGIRGLGEDGLMMFYGIWGMPSRTV